MLPSDILIRLQKIDEKKYSSVIKELTKKNIEYYAKRMGVTSSGMIKSMSEVFETFGLGKMQIIDLNNKKKKAVIRISNTPFIKDCKDLKIKNCVLHNATLSGMFSFLFKKDVKSETKACMVKNKKYCEFVIK